MTKTVTTNQQEWATSARAWFQQQVENRKAKVATWQTVGASFQTVGATA